MFRGGVRPETVMAVEDLVRLILKDSGKESCHSESHNAAPADVWGHSARPLLLLLLLSAENLLSSTWLMFLSLASTSPRHQKVPRDRAKEGRYPLV